MKKANRIPNRVSNEEAEYYASNVMRGIQNSVFSSLNSNQNIRCDSYSANVEGWHNHSQELQRDWLVSNSTLQTRNAQNHDSSSCLQNVSEEFEESYDEKRNKGCCTVPQPIMYSSKPNIVDYGYYSQKQYKENDSDVSIPEENNYCGIDDGKLAKKCPACFEINLPNANWCMECGKAILSVEVRRYDNVGKPCDKIPSQHKSKSLPSWNRCMSLSPPKGYSYNEQLSVENMSSLVRNMSIDNCHHTSANITLGNNFKSYQEKSSSISFDFENPQFDDLVCYNSSYPKHHAVYRRASYDENCKGKEDFYPFDDLLYPEFAIYDPYLGHAFPSSNIVSNGAYFEQPAVWQKKIIEDQHLATKSNHFQKRNGSSRKKRKRYRKRQSKEISSLGESMKGFEKCHNEDSSQETNHSNKADHCSECYWGLPDEVIVYIFSYLKMKELATCLRVCKTFNRLAGDGSLWKQIYLKKHHSLNDDILTKIARWKPVSLTLTQCNGRGVTMDGLRYLFQNCSNSIEKLDVSCSNGGALIGESILLHAFRCKNIHTLDVSWTNVSNACIQSMSTAANRLVHLSLNGCQTITDESIELIVNTHGDSLRTLEVFGCFNISPISTDLIGKHCKNLTKLNVGQCHKVSNIAVSNIAKNLSKLKILDLRGCKMVRDASLRDVSIKCKDLKTLVIANCPCVTDVTLINIARNLTTLECLDACGCGKISDRGVCTLAKALNNLSTLDVSSTKVTCRSVTSLAQDCERSLCALKLSFCHSINDNCLRSLVSRCKKLHTLHLYGCKPPRNLQKIVEINPNLKIERESLR